MSERRSVRPVIAAVVFVIALAVYVRTLAPTVFLIDSGPLTVAAWSLGNAHPPGFPLFLAVTHLTSRLPFESVAWRTNFASALFAALACAMVSLAIAELTSQKLAMLLGGLMLAFSRTLWGYATITEVYALNTLLICAMVWLALRRRFYLAAIVLGLALGVHHVTVVLAFLGALAVVSRNSTRKQLVGAAICAIVVAVAVYAYLPLAASRDPVLNWGDPDNARDIVRHATGKVYRSYVKTSAIPEQLGDIGRMVTREFGVLGLLLSLFGLWVAFRHDRTLFWMLAVMIVAACAWLTFYPIVDDEDAYLLPAFVAMVIAAAYGAALAGKHSWLFLAIPLIATISHWPDRDRSKFHVAHDYAMNTLRGMAGNSILITRDRHLWGALLYLTEVETVRPDVKVVMYPLLIRSWYAEGLDREYERLVDVYEDDERRWRNDAALRAEFQRRLDDLVMSLIASRPHAYVTPDIVTSSDEVDRHLIARIKAAYDLVPGGLALELLPGHRIRMIHSVPLEMRGLADATDETVKRDIVPVYDLALKLRERYLQATGQ